MGLSFLITKMKFPKFPKWQDGRQGTGHKVLTLINSKLLKFDCHVLKYPTGSYIPFHTDPAKEGYKHYRLNIILTKAAGGAFICPNYSGVFKWWRFHFFRPDVTEHCVTPVWEGTRYVFSIGWLKKVRSLV
jgi:hypothetical protein